MLNQLTVVGADTVAVLKEMGVLTDDDVVRDDVHSCCKYCIIICIVLIAY